ncbi:MAG: universal stress protein [Bdellovibrionales bacterium]|nr:universal stress protein [Bdellovibrionales bacterium]
MKTYVLCSTLEQHSIDTLKKIKDTLDLSNAFVHIVTIVEIKTYNLEYIPYSYPAENQFQEIENSAGLILLALAKDLGIKKETLVTKCFFDSSRERKIKEYLENVEADLVVTATRGKHGIGGFFSSSFTDYLCKFSPCDVFVMRPN